MVNIIGKGEKKDGHIVFPSLNLAISLKERTMNPHVAIVVLNWNGWQDTLQCLDSLALQEYPNASIIVVDNASTDGSKDRILKWSNDRGKGWIRRQFVIDAGVPEMPSLDVLCHGDFVYMQSEVNGG